jgi:preprotein translocase subunit SecY
MSEGRAGSTVGFLSTAAGRLLISVALTAPLFLLPHVLIPGIDSDSARSLFRSVGGGSTEQLSVAALGLTPVLLAFQLVELVALAIPRLRWRRVSGSWPRRPLTIASLLLAGLFGLVQAFFICRWIEASTSSYRTLGPLLTREGWAFTGPALLSLVGTTAALVGCAHAIRRWGLGNGYSWLLAAAVASSLVDQGLRIWSALRIEQIAPVDALATAALIGALAWGCHRLARPRPWLALPVAEGLTLEPLLPTCGLGPLVLAASLLVLPASLRNVGLPLEGVANALAPGSTVYLTADLILVGGFGLLLARAFYPPGVVLRFLEELGGRVGRSLSCGRPELAASLQRAAFRSAALIAALPVLQHLLGRRLVLGGLVELLVLVMVLIDLQREWRTRRADPSLTVVWELHRLYAVAPIRALLEARGISVTVRGLQHRRLMFFFGPFVPVELLAPAARADEAASLIAEWSGLEATD